MWYYYFVYYYVVSHFPCTVLAVYIYVFYAE